MKSILHVGELTPEHVRKFHSLGGAKWFRKAIERAKEPIKEERRAIELTDEERMEILRLCEIHPRKFAAREFRVSLNTITHLQTQARKKKQ